MFNLDSKHLKLGETKYLIKKSATCSLVEKLAHKLRLVVALMLLSLQENPYLVAKINPHKVPISAIK
jgi:hypothetical protein